MSLLVVAAAGFRDVTKRRRLRHRWLVRGIEQVAVIVLERHVLDDGRLYCAAGRRRYAVQVPVRPYACAGPLLLRRRLMVVVVLVIVIWMVVLMFLLVIIRRFGRLVGHKGCRRGTYVVGVYVRVTRRRRHGLYDVLINVGIIMLLLLLLLMVVVVVLLLLQEQIVMVLKFGILHQELDSFNGNDMIT